MPQEHGQSCTLTIDDALALAEILRIQLAKAHVARLVDNGDVVHGTARAFVKSPDQPYFLGGDDDIRDAYLWVTTVGGFEAYWPVSELVNDQPQGYFVEYDR